MDKPLALLLTRVSTKQQDNDPQINALCDYADQLGYTYVKDDIIATTESGFRSIERKEGFAKVQKYFVNHPDCKTLIITELSRLSRYDTVLLHIRDYLIDNKIQLRVKDNAFALFENGSVSSSANLTFSIFSSLASSEMQQKRERFSRAKKALREDGFFVGGRVPYGYAINRCGDKHKILVVNERQAEQIQKIFQLYASGLSIPKIRQEAVCGGFDQYFHSQTNVQKCLRNRAYNGTKTTDNRRKNYQYYELGNVKAEQYVSSSYKYTYPTIVADELFNKVQDMLSAKNISDKSSKHISILSKLLCPVECGRCLIAEHKVKPDYACKRECEFDHACGKKRYSVSMFLLDSIIWEFMKGNIKAIARDQIENANEQQLDLIDQKICNLRKELVLAEEKRRRIINVYVNSQLNATDADAQYAKYMSKITHDISKDNALIKQLEHDRDEINNVLKSKVEFCLQDKLRTISNDAAKQQEYIKQFIDTIIVHLSDRYYTVLEVRYRYTSHYSLSLDKPDVTPIICNSKAYIIMDKMQKRALSVDVNDKRDKNGKLLEEDVKFERGSEGIGFRLIYCLWELSTIFERQCRDIDDYFGTNPKCLKLMYDFIIDFHIHELPYPKRDF